MLKCKSLRLLSSTILGTLLLLPYPANSDVLPQIKSNQEWQQPYTPTRLEWLFANLPANHTIINCAARNVGQNGQFRWVASYRWSRATNGLRLTVKSAPDNLNYCTSVAFEELRYESLQMGFSPPRIELLHYLNDENGSQIKDKPVVYTCFVPAKTSQNDYNTGKFEDNCQVNTASH